MSGEELAPFVAATLRDSVVEQLQNEGFNALRIDQLWLVNTFVIGWRKRMIRRQKATEMGVE